MMGNRKSGMVNGVGTALYPLEGKKNDVPTAGSAPKVISKWIKS